MADFNNFMSLIRSNQYTPIEYFSLNGYCYFVKIVHSSGAIYIVNISKNYQLKIPTEMKSNYDIVREDPQHKEFDSEQLNQYYPNINLISKPDMLDDVSEQLNSTYKQSIVVNSDIQNYIEQMKRLRYCFRSLEHKLSIIDRQYIIHLGFDNRIYLYRIENYPKKSYKTFYITFTLEQMYSKINNAHHMVLKVENEFYNILDLNQSKHNQYLSTDYANNFIHNNSSFLQTKRKLLSSKTEISKILMELQQKEDKLIQEYKKSIQSKNDNSNIFREAQNVKIKTEYEKKLNKIILVKDQVFQKIVYLDTKIKDIYLVIDQLGFNLSISLNELRAELQKMSD